nr:ribonuclease HII [Pelagibacterales bacterium]
KRRDLVSYILEHSHAVGIGVCDNFEIDKLNIHNATLLSMKRAVNNLNLEPGLVYIDGIHKPDISIKSECFIKGDQKIPEISAASIIAKVLRDNEMIILDSMLKVYGFANHKGYGTKEHMMAIDIFGPSVYHRLSFSPLNNGDL